MKEVRSANSQKGFLQFLALAGVVVGAAYGAGALIELAVEATESFRRAKRRTKAAIVAVPAALIAGNWAHNASYDSDVAKRFDNIIAADVERSHGRSLPAQRECLINAGVESYREAHFAWRREEKISFINHRNKTMSYDREKFSSLSGMFLGKPKLSEQYGVNKRYESEILKKAALCATLPGTSSSPSTEKLIQVFKDSKLAPANILSSSGSSDPAMKYAIHYSIE